MRSTSTAGLLRLGPFDVLESLRLVEGHGGTVIVVFDKASYRTLSGR